MKERTQSERIGLMNEIQSNQKQKREKPGKSGREEELKKTHCCDCHPISAGFQFNSSSFLSSWIRWTKSVHCFNPLTKNIYFRGFACTGLNYDSPQPCHIILGVRGRQGCGIGFRKGLLQFHLGLHDTSKLLAFQREANLRCLPAMVR